MGCGCGGNTATKDVSHHMAAPILERNFKEVFMSEDFIPVIYRGPNYTHLIPSRTGVLVKYNLKNYGLGKGGVKIRVHKDDIAKFPELYEVIEEPINTIEEDIPLTIESFTSAEEPVIIAKKKPTAKTVRRKTKK